MQIPSKVSDPFMKTMTVKAEKVQSLVLEQMKQLTRKVALKVMLGDGTVSDQESFDPALVRRFYEDIVKKLTDWTTDGPSMTSDQDLRRIFIKFEIKEGNYVLSIQISLQYHALLFYKPDHRVIDIQKELSEITDKIKDLQEKASPESDKLIEDILKQKGYTSLDHQKLFEVLFENNDLTSELEESLKSHQTVLNTLFQKRDSLFKMLDDMLIEIYHTTPVMIDEMRMIGAEEGWLCIFNLEHMKNNSKQGSFDPARIPNKVKERLLQRMDTVIKILEF